MPESVIDLTDTILEASRDTGVLNLDPQANKFVQQLVEGVQRPLVTTPVTSHQVFSPSGRPRRAHKEVNYAEAQWLNPTSEEVATPRKTRGSRGRGRGRGRSTATPRQSSRVLARKNSAESEETVAASAAGDISPENPDSAAMACDKSSATPRPIRVPPKPMELIWSKLPTVDLQTAQRENAAKWHEYMRSIAHIKLPCHSRSQSVFEVYTPHTPIPIHMDKFDFSTVVQSGSCLASKIHLFPQCRTCTNRKGDVCRFQGIRVFRDSDQGLEFGPYFQSQPKLSMQPYQAWCPVRRDPSSQTDHPNEVYLQRLTNAAMHQLVTHQLAFCDDPTSPSYLRVMAGSRQSCDQCLTSIFNGFWLCSAAGCEYCENCYQDLTKSPQIQSKSTATHSTPESDSKRESAMDLLVNCKKVVGKVRYSHIPEQMVRVRRLDLDDLRQTQTAIESRMNQYSTLPPLISVPDSLPEGIYRVPESETSISYIRGDYNVFSRELFQAIWREGRPVAVENLLGRLNLPWDPAHWQNQPIQDDIQIIDCCTGLIVQQHQSLADFFREFDKLDDSIWSTRAPTPPPQEATDENESAMDPATDKPDTTGTDLGQDQQPPPLPQMTPFAKMLRQTHQVIPKIKDWPPNADFKDVFPDHFADFMQALPFPEYTLRDGQLNLVSRLPGCFIPPELGPKMYIAYASSDQPGSKGTTNLHLDMADAINLMVYSPPVDDPTGPDAPPAAAVWDIFPFEDLPKIRNFLRNRAQRLNISFDDPIHDQSIYLHTGLLAQLFEEEGVRPWRVLQNPGDAVFVPAGCAHQVCNYANCIKVAMDFVSPENISRCYQLTTEFRLLKHRHLRKPDLLQLQSILYHAWLDSEVVMSEQLEDWQRATQAPPAPLPPSSVTAHKNAKRKTRSSSTTGDHEEDTNDSQVVGENNSERGSPPPAKTPRKRGRQPKSTLSSTSTPTSTPAVSTPPTNGRGNPTRRRKRSALSIDSDGSFSTSSSPPDVS